MMWAGNHHKQCGFTLVELLIVVALIGTLAALLLPAVQSARETSHRALCANNLRQLGTAFHAYETAKNAFPVGARSQVTFGVSWWAHILPWIEQSSLYAQLDISGPSSGSLLSSARNALAVNALLVPTMSCPSSPLPLLGRVGAVEVMLPSYVGIAGATSDDGFPEKRVTTCCLPENKGQISGGGMLVPNMAILARDVRDGLSNTIIVSECSNYSFDQKGRTRRVDGGYPNGWLTGTAASGTPPTYRPAAAPPSWNIVTIRYAPNMTQFDRAGIGENRGANNPLLSAHPQGVNALFADGSVHFVADSVSLRLLKSQATRDDGQVDLFANL